MEKPTAAHNPEVVGSSPAPATIKTPLSSRKAVFFSALLQLWGTSPFPGHRGDPNRAPRRVKKSARRRHFRLRVFLLFREIFRSLQRRRHDLFHGPGSLLLGRCRDVGVSVQGESCREVPQHPGHRLDVHPILKGQCCEGMPQVMEPDFGQSRPFQHRWSMWRTLSGEMGPPVGEGNTQWLLPTFFFCCFRTAIVSSASGSVR